MNKKKQKNSMIKSITLAVFFVSIILIYFSHITSKDNGVKHKANKSELEELTDYDMVNNYPKSARDAVKLHCRYSKLIYGNDIDEETLVQVCNQMRQLYSSELLSYNVSSNYVNAMKKDIERMEEEGLTYRNYELPEASQIQYYNQYGKEMATMEVTITMATKDEVGYYYQQYVLVKENDKWKILAWGESQLGLNHSN